MAMFPSIPDDRRHNDSPFGDLDAERDDLLIASFVDLGYIKPIKDGHVTMLTGPKGAGKSAIVRYFKENKDANLFVSSYEKSRLTGLFHFLHIDNKTTQIIDAVSEILLLLTAIESIARDHGLFGNPIWQKTEKIFNDLNIQLTINRKTFERKFEFELIKIFTKLSLTTKSDSPSITLAHLQSISSQFKKCIEDLEITNKHLIFLDNLDDDYSKIPFHEFKGPLSSLITISDRLNSYNSNIRFVILLRDDILKRLYDSNLGKIIDRSKQITWGNTAEEVATRFGKFIENRLKALPPKVKYHSKDGWGMLFEECYGRAMEPWSNLNPEKLIDKTMWRPRDLLKIMNSLYINFKSINPLFKSDTLKQASFNTEKSYSEYFLRELNDAAHAEINEIVDFDQLMRTYKMMKRPSYYAKEWEAHISNKLRLSSEKSTRLLEILFDHSAIGTYSESHGQRWAYRGHHGEFDIDEKILTHQGLYKTLGFYFQEQ